MKNYKLLEARLNKFQACLAEQYYPPSLFIDVDMSRADHFSKKELPPMVHRTLEFIHSHLFDQQLTVGYLKKRCNINGNNLSGRFTYYTGKTPKRYVTIFRVDASARLLKDSDLQSVRIADIALYVGYHSASTYSKAFKRITGLTPGYWRTEKC